MGYAARALIQEVHVRALAAAALLLVACQTPQPPAVPGTLATQGEAVMTVNGQPITQQMVDAVTMRIPPEQLERMVETPGQMERFHEQLAMGTLLYEKAIAEGLHQDPAVQAGLAMAAREFLAGVYVARKGEAAVTEEAVQKYYEERSVQFARPQVKARHILVDSESRALELKKQIEGGADFAEIAREHSSDRGSARTGGDLGWFEEGRMVEEFSTAAFAAEKGALVGPVQTRFGFHLIEVQDKREKTPLEEVRDQIVASLRQDAVQELIENTRQSMKIEHTDSKTAGAPDAAEASAEPVQVKPPAEAADAGTPGEATP